jgi:hypothetical protein
MSQKQTVNQRNAQYLKGRPFQVGEIARIFKVPMFLLGDPYGGASTYASAEHPIPLAAKVAESNRGKRKEPATSRR